ncbi:MAG TPA: DUF4386 domain-containing protein [Gammaproteobacteria bacterium]|nr:DUF4386 domain-containing protein [Gammaproteobacteria bacterium]
MKNARIAGILYLIVVLSGIFSLAYVPSRLIVWDSAPATVQNIMDSELLFRMDIVSGLICHTFFLFLSLVLYQLFKPVDKTMAALMVILVAVSVPISFINSLNKFNVLSLLSGADYLVSQAEHLQSQVMLSLASFNDGILIAQIFWGLWLFPFGYLVFKSGFLPKILGVFLIAGCFGYLINFFGYSLLPGYHESGIPALIDLPSRIGEIGICLWLLIMGAKHGPKYPDKHGVS